MTVTTHKPQDLICLFNSLFTESENTELVKGEDEPIYLPANAKQPLHQVVFAHGFYASAFHEIAHWCIAGRERRLLEDYGYWYAPDGRNEIQQQKFELVEIKPQAIEWAFCVASGFKFNVSADNLSGIDVDRYGFQCKVHKQVLAYLQNGFPSRAQLFIDALLAYYQPGLTLTADMFAFSNPLFETKSAKELECIAL